MSNNKKAHSILFFLSVFYSVISSLSLLAAMMINSDGDNKEIIMAFGILFWIGLVLEQVFILMASRKMKIAIQNNKFHTDRKPGIISFFSCVEGAIADIVFFISLIAFILCIIFDFGEDLIQYILICLMVMSFRLHCFFNGRNYNYKKIKKER